MHDGIDIQWQESRPTIGETASCDDLHVFLYELVDKELTEADCAKLELHLAQCPDCAEMVAAETELRDVLKKCTTSPAPASLRSKIAQVIAETEFP
ncbi:mycothiol system anti-sigma-R factor [Corynebacterium mustelae]|uniref:Mycothiol system anti-sigma-R factor n=1 Tax=Corynebacterium mustelae TaxID=571915 RepID=A0A0G3H012_9CORY|nr:mycothiol system anti-sigma-R factor [Corynebacterium mustelae]AKK05138.1 mycothiol system anti-sigma-R factor [Corynebacterium mustelae]